MKRLGFLLAFALAFVSVRGASLTFLGISDVHVGNTALPYWETGEPIANYIWLSNNVPHAFSLFTGDLMEYDTNVPTFLSQAVYLDGPKYYCMGNHDPLTATNYFAANGFCFTNGNYKFVGFSSQPSVSADDMITLFNNLTNSTQYHLVVASHFCLSSPVDDCIPEPYYSTLTNWMHAFNVALYIHGHNHQCNFLTNTMNGMWTVQNPSLQYTCGSGAAVGSMNVFTLSGTNMTVQRRAMWESAGDYSVKATTTFALPEYLPPRTSINSLRTGILRGIGQ